MAWSLTQCASFPFYPLSSSLSVCQYCLPSLPLEDDGAADEDAHQQDHGPDGRKGSGLRGGRGLAL